MRKRRKKKIKEIKEPRLKKKLKEELRGNVTRNGIGQLD